MGNSVKKIKQQNLMAGAELGRKIVADILQTLSVIQNNQTVVLIDGVNLINPVFTSGGYTSKSLYDLISSTVINESSTSVKLSGSSFPDVMLSLYEILDFTNENYANIQNQVDVRLDELRTSYESHIGDLDGFPDSILDWASPPTTWETLLSTVDITRVLTSPALGGDEVLPAVVNYINAKKALKNADDEIKSNKDLIAALVSATKNPKLPNACQFKDPPSIKPLYKLNLTDKAQVENSLSNNNSLIEINFKIVKSTKTEMHISFNNDSNSNSSSIDVSSYIDQNDWLTAIINGSVVSVSALISPLSLFEIDIQFLWKGVTTLTPIPASYPPNGWYSSSEVNSAIKNKSNNNNGGWKFSSKPKLPIDFSIISQLIISNPVEINIIATKIIEHGSIVSVPRHNSQVLPNGITNFTFFGWSFDTNCEYQSNFILDSKSYRFHFVPLITTEETANVLGVVTSSPFGSK